MSFSGCPILSTLHGLSHLLPLQNISPRKNQQANSQIYIQKSRIAKILLKKYIYTWVHPLSNIKTYYKDIVIQTVLYG